MRNSHKLMLGLGLGLLILIQIGDQIDNPPVRISKWVPRTAKEVIKRAPRTRATYSERPWAKSEKESSEEWADFIEDLENRGLDIWDPQAEDIWEEFY
jgi:hypothetical protein